MRTVVCGVGNAMKGDDGIGPAVISELKKELDTKLDPEELMLLDCGTAPENFIGKITWFDPERVVIVDAADTGSEPGTVSVIDTGQIVGERISTHNLPLDMFVKYLRDMFRNSLEVVFIGAQPNGSVFGNPLSEDGHRAVQEIKRRVMELL